MARTNARSDARSLSSALRLSPGAASIISASPTTGMPTPGIVVVWKGKREPSISDACMRGCEGEGGEWTHAVRRRRERSGGRLYTQRKIGYVCGAFPSRCTCPASSTPPLPSLLLPPSNSLPSSSPPPPSPDAFQARAAPEGESSGSRPPAYLWGAGKVAEIKGHQHHDAFWDLSRESCNFLPQPELTRRGSLDV
jgi:hypothetical protein